MTLSYIVVVYKYKSLGCFVLVVLFKHQYHTEVAGVLILSEFLQCFGVMVKVIPYTGYIQIFTSCESGTQRCAIYYTQVDAASLRPKKQKC